MIVKLPKYCDKVDDIYGLEDGELGGYDGRKVDWFPCREDFQRNCPRVDRILYHTNKRHFKNIIALVDKVEKLLKLSKCQKAQIYHTDHEGILFCRLGKFWRKKCRRELFTILLRDGANYNPKKSFWRFVQRTEYLYEFIPAFKYFLKGNTRYKSRYFDGWVNEFNIDTVYEAEIPMSEYLKRKLGK